MNNRTGKSNNNLFGTGFSLRRFLLETAPSLLENGNRTRNFDIERGQLEATRRERKYPGSGEGSHSKSNRRNSFDSSKQPLTTNTFTVASASTSNKIKQKKKLNSNEPILSSTLSTSNSSSTSSSWNSDNDEEIKNNQKWFIEKNFCPICYTIPVLPNEFKELLLCKHEICHRCLERYVKNEILEFRTAIACPQCSESIHPSDIEMILKYDKKIISKYEDYMIRKHLLADPDSRWCPAPDCGYAVIATGCASCPRIRCQRPNCGLLFCYHCKNEWHPDQTCDAARAIRQQQQQQHPNNQYKSYHQFDIQNPSNRMHRSSELQLNSDDVKPCPRCHVLIVKMDDGSCNHMVCSICSAEFCWLCMKEITDLHYLSPSGCTFWGKKPWSRKKKIMWQLGTLVGAPVGIGLVAGIALPIMIIGIPVWIGKKIYIKYFKETKLKRNLAVATSVLASFIISPVLAGLAVAIGVPILLFYVYGVVPISLCRTGCNVGTSNDGLQTNETSTTNAQTISGATVIQNEKMLPSAEHKLLDTMMMGNSSIIDSLSRSIGDVSLSVGSISNIAAVVTSNDNNDKKYDQDSTTGLAGSINADNGSCTGSGAGCESLRPRENQIDVCSVDSSNPITLSQGDDAVRKLSIVIDSTVKNSDEPNI